MNIFATDSCPFESADALPDVLVNKMILESAQMLSTAHFELDGQQVGYKPTHKNHPCAVWARASTGNYDWLFTHLLALVCEYNHRAQKQHATARMLKALQQPPKQCKVADASFTFCCMPDELKQSTNIHENYRSYLNQKYAAWANRTDKRPIVAKWTNRTKPKWVL